jgi:putative addiction module component (TIGR02574 family)
VKSGLRLTIDLEGLMLDTVNEEGSEDRRERIAMRIGKQALRDLVEGLPEEVEIDDVLDRIYLRGKLEAVEHEVPEGSVVPHPDVGLLLDRALRLEEDERADLAGRLLESLDTEVEEGVEEAWRKEVERRMTELDEGVVEPVSWEEVQARVFGRSRGQSDS